MLLRLLPKPFLFGLFGAMGCLLGAIVGEAALALVGSPQVLGQAVDILFVMDITGSMRGEIDGVKDGIEDFVAKLGRRDVRVGLVTFGDECYGDKTETLPFTQDADAFSRAVANVPLVYGGDDPESSFEALVLGARQAFAPGASKVMVLITDAEPHVQGGANDCAAASGAHPPTEQQTVEALRQIALDQLHLVVAPDVVVAYSGLRAGLPGSTFTLDERGRQDFAALMPRIGASIASALGTQSVDPAQAKALLAATAAWTALLAAGAFLLLGMGQNAYLGRAVFTPDTATLGGLAGVALAGAVAGGLAQGLAAQFSSAEGGSLGAPARIMVWALLGAVLGRGIAWFVPNLPAWRALAGGALGGTCGAMGFVWMAGIGIGDLPARLTGATLLGFLIGLMISLAEMAFRKAWLEVAYGPKEIRTVNLGHEAVSVGGDAGACTVYAAGAAPRAYAYRLEQGGVVCEDVARGRRERVALGHQQRVGNLTITVRGMAALQEGAAPASGAAWALRLGGQQYPLEIGRRFTARELPGLTTDAADGAVAEVSRNPNDPTVLGLKNLSLKAWEARLSGGGVREVRPGQSVRLAEGNQVVFGPAVADIVRAAGD